MNITIVRDPGFQALPDEALPVLSDLTPADHNEEILFAEVDSMVVRVGKYMQELGSRMKLAGGKDKAYTSAFIGYNLVGFIYNRQSETLTLHWKYRPSHVMASMGITVAPDEVASDGSAFHVEEDPKEYKVVFSPEHEISRLNLFSLSYRGAKEIQDSLNRYCKRQLVLCNPKDAPANPYKGTAVVVSDIRFFEIDYVECTLRALLLMQEFPKMTFYDDAFNKMD